MVHTLVTYLVQLGLQTKHVIRGGAPIAQEQFALGALTTTTRYGGRQVIWPRWPHIHATGHAKQTKRKEKKPCALSE
jgi:hypothetical protein